MDGLKNCLNTKQIIASNLRRLDISENQTIRNMPEESHAIITTPMRSRRRERW